MEQNPGELEEMVVNARRATTATKTDTLIVETPQAISVIAAELFEGRRARNVVEALRGPSSVLYSRGANGGIVNLAGKQPLFETRGEFAKMNWMRLLPSCKTARKKTS